MKMIWKIFIITFSKSIKKPLRINHLYYVLILLGFAELLTFSNSSYLILIIIITRKLTIQIIK